MSYVSNIEKNSLKRKIKKQHGLTSSYTKPMGYICGKVSLTQEAIDGLGALDADFVIFSEQKKYKKSENILFLGYDEVAEDIFGFDFFVCGKGSDRTEYFMKKQIVPIVQQKHYLGSILKEFDAVEARGNCFLYDGKNHFSMLGSVMKYLANCTYAQDKNCLLKNLRNT
ncbi:hypothetical protein N9J72_00305 [Candidatus Gracilibacteria bacterium]|nr:hypothetical protein [Candidatus Gracilibacteria bacterium]